MRVTSLAVLLLAACGSDGRVNAPLGHAQPTKPTPEAKSETKEWLLVYVNLSPLYACRLVGPGTRGECSPLDAPPSFEQIRKVDENRYLLEAKERSSLWNPATGELTALPGVHGAEMRLRDGTLLRINAHPTYSGIDRANASGAFEPLDLAPGPHTTDHAVAPDGAHLYKFSPGLGRHESAHFAGVVPGYPVSLYFSKLVGATPKKLQSGDEFMLADFADNESLVAWWRPGRADEKKNTRTLFLDVMDLATGAVRTLDEVTLPYVLRFANGAGTIERGCPRTTLFPLSHYAFYEVEQPSDMPGATRYRLTDLRDGSKVDLPLRHDRTLEERVATPIASGMGTDRQYADYVAVWARAPDETQASELRVMKVPSMQVVMVAKLPLGWIHGADWIER